MEESMNDQVDGKNVLMTFNRRSFIKLTGVMILSSSAVVLGIGACSGWREEYQVPQAPKGSYQLNGDQVVLSLTAVDSLSVIGGAVRLVFGEGEEIVERLIVIRSENEKYQAFIDHCTHNDKELYYLRESKILRCHSGKSHFNMEGSVIKGPAEKPLHVFPTWQETDQLMIEMKSGVKDV
jgi:nitrite reductase/ring-hydroxylating ferredoxin subunit